MSFHENKHKFIFHAVICTYVIRGLIDLAWACETIDIVYSSNSIVNFYIRRHLNSHIDWSSRAGRFLNRWNGPWWAWNVDWRFILLYEVIRKSNHNSILFYDTKWIKRNNKYVFKKNTLAYEVSHFFIPISFSFRPNPAGVFFIYTIYWQQ